MTSAFLEGFFCTDLEDVECFELDVSAVISEQVHHQLQVLSPADVLGHDSEVVSIQEKFPEELKDSPRLNDASDSESKAIFDTERCDFYLQRLSFGDVIVRMQELLVLCKHLTGHLRVC